MSLESLLVKHNYRVEQINKRVVVTPDEDGNYKATCREDVERALTDRSQIGDVFVTLSPNKKWKLLPK